MTLNPAASQYCLFNFHYVPARNPRKRPCRSAQAVLFA